MRLGLVVPRAGFEPAQSLDHEILSLARIPISPPRLKKNKIENEASLVSRARIELATY